MRKDKQYAEETDSSQDGNFTTRNAGARIQSHTGAAESDRKAFDDFQRNSARSHCKPVVPHALSPMSQSNINPRHLVEGKSHHYGRDCSS